MVQKESAKEIYESVDCVWPENNRWYDYTHHCIIQFVEASLKNRLTSSSIYLNAGSGGSTYDLSGECYHVDIAVNLINKFQNHIAASIESLPFPNETFDAAICVGSVLNYCDIAASIKELVRTLKPGGYLVLEFERSHTGELLGNQEYGKGATIQNYEYMGHIHTLYLYSEQVVNRLLKENGLHIVKRKRFHCLSSLISGITKQEEASGRFAPCDLFFKPFSFFLAHNILILCKKSGSFRNFTKS